MWLSTVLGQLRPHLAVVALVALSAAIQVGCDKGETVLTIEKPTEVHSINQVSSSSSDPAEAKIEPGKVVRVLTAGETAKAIGVYHGKDWDAFHVKLEDGTEGLIIAGDTFKAGSR